VARAGNVLTRSQKRISELDSTAHKDPDVLSEIVFQECNSERDKLIEATVLRRRGYNWESFRAQGKDLCTEAVYFDVESEIAAVKLSLDFLIFGFDDVGKPHIRFTNWKTPPENYDELGFYAIGTGAPNAISSIAHAIEYLDFSKHGKESTILYHVMAAKFMAESAQDVGTATFVIIAHADNSMSTIDPTGGNEYIRERWKKEGAPRTPRGIQNAIEAILCKSSDFNSNSLEAASRASKYIKSARKIVAAAAKKSGSQKSE